MSAQNVQVVVSCPSCGAKDYEVEFDETELGSMVSLPCDECPNRIVVDIDVRVQSEAPLSVAPATVGTPATKETR